MDKWHNQFMLLSWALAEMDDNWIVASAVYIWHGRNMIAAKQAALWNTSWLVSYHHLYRFTDVVVTKLGKSIPAINCAKQGDGWDMRDEAPIELFTSINTPLNKGSDTARLIRSSHWCLRNINNRSLHDYLRYPSPLVHQDCERIQVATGEPLMSCLIANISLCYIYISSRGI